MITRLYKRRPPQPQLPLHGEHVQHIRVGSKDDPALLVQQTAAFAFANLRHKAEVREDSLITVTIRVDRV